ncbi:MULTISPECIES: ABC transporter permease [unclassified Mesorhizobium]|uniref:ABC transporter permease n=1 Tax=unclassified Mesorhizobium TaxID=325217 RepID=UPI002415539D|nr:MULTISPECIES: ABC transporter permease [unclassified Mesorhizobium]MDG4889933.1 ABC transporter permease [Mesorhizobium sp. WSM4887]MDG4904076.1 ABC transporter permease [Mesorhizobium sp. WSM4962]MDG4909103.1 ABC transporter permease [Mesorhizobium sp. WSM4898]MDG4921727.1 ABC transporter permease [Mesorhizobium sp. WSM4989]
MTRFIVGRLTMAFFVAITVSAITFLMLNFSGDPAIAIAGEGASADNIAQIRVQYGFDRPVVVQYFDWLGRAMTGDLGYSYYFKLPVSQLLAQHLGVTMLLGLLSITFALILSLPLGIVAAVKPNSFFDRLSLFLAVVGQAIPSFWFGLILIVVFAIKLRWLPASGASSWKSFVMPTVVLGYYATPALMRLTRAGMLEVLTSDYIRTARAKGLSSRKILFKHALRNAVIPVVSLAAVQMGFMLGGSIIVESVFALQGAGLLAWQSIARNDIPTMQALILVFSMFYIVFTLVADLLNAWLDPRLRKA